MYYLSVCACLCVCVCACVCVYEHEKCVQNVYILKCWKMTYSML